MKKLLSLLVLSWLCTGCVVNKVGDGLKTYTGKQIGRIKVDGDYEPYSVHEVEIDGATYLVVNFGEGISICPKVEAPKKSGLIKLDE